MTKCSDMVQLNREELLMPWFSGLLPFSSGNYLFSSYLFACCRTRRNCYKREPEQISDSEQTRKHDGIEIAASIGT